MSSSRLLVPSVRRAAPLLRHQPRIRNPIIRRAFASPADSLIRPTQTTTLPNGLSVATEYSPYLQTATVGIWIDAGSRAETDATSGTAHFLEHLAFKGTTSRSQTQLELEIENMGAHLNAYTAREQTVYYARCFKHDVGACVGIISDILQNSKFEESAIEREREVILREQEEVDKQFEEVVFDHLHATAFPNQPLGRTILGPKENILSIKRNDLVDYINKNYRADRMVLVSAGGVPHDELVKLAEKHFGKVPPSGSVTGLGQSSKTKPRFIGSEIRIRDDTMQHAHIALAVEGVGHKDPDYWTMLVMQAVVGNWDRALGSAPHLGSRLSSIVSKNGLANSFMSFSTSYSDTGLWGIYLVTENRIQMDDLVHFCLREWCRLSTSVTEAEVERAKAQLRASLLLSLDSTTPIAEDIGRQLVTTGRRMSPEEIEKVVGAVTVADVRRVANERLWDQDLAISALGPVEGLLDYQRVRSDMSMNACVSCVLHVKQSQLVCPFPPVKSDKIFFVDHQLFEASKKDEDGDEVRRMPDTSLSAVPSKRRKVVGQETIATRSSRVPQIFTPFRAIGIVANQVPPAVQARGNAYHVTTCVGKSFQTYDCAKLNLLFVGGETKDPISAVEAAGDYVFVAAGNQVLGYLRGKLALRMPEIDGKVTRLLHLATMMVAISCSPPRLHVFNIPEEELMSSLNLGEGGEVTAIMHPATWLNKVVLGRESGQVQIWNIRTGKRIFETESFESSVTSLAQSPALDVLAIGLHSGTIHIRNMRTDTEIITFSQPQPVQSLSFRTDGLAFLASSSPTGRISTFDLNKRRVIHTVETSHKSQPVNLQFLPGQPILLTTSKGNSLKLFIFEESGPRLLKSRSGHSSPPTRLHMHSAKWLFSAADGRLHAQSLFNDSQSFEFSQSALMEGYMKQSAGQGYAAGRIGDVIAIGSSTTREEEWDSIITASRGERGARTWSWKRKAVGNHLLVTGDKSGITAACVSHCGNFGAIGSEKGCIEVFNMQSGIKRKRFLEGHKRSVTFVGMDKLNKTLISAGSDGLVILWDFKTAKIKGRIDIGSAVTIGKLQNGLLALSCDDLSIRVIDSETPGGRIVRELWGHSNRITDFAFSPDSNWIISVSLDSTLRVWDLPTGFLISAVRLVSIATAVAFSPSGEFLATAHVGSLGVHLWSNRSQFRTIPVRHINDEHIPTITESLPSIGGREGEGILEGAFDETEPSEDEDVGGTCSVDQLSENLLTLSLQPRSKMWSLLNLEAIRRRNKAREPIKPPEKAPFFLPAIKDSTKVREGVDDNASVQTQSDSASKSRILSFQGNHVQSEFSRLLQSEEYEELIQHMMVLTPSQLDYSLRIMSLLEPYAEPLNFVRALTSHLRTKRDFELVQAWMLAFLRIQQDWLLQVRDNDEVQQVMKEWEDVHFNERERVGSIVGYVGGVLSFIRGI